MHKLRLRGILPGLIAVAIFFFIVSGMTNSANAGEAILTWDPPTTNTDGTPLTDLAGYKIHYGTTSGNYTTVIDVGNVTTYTVTNLTNNVTYYFATTAYDSSGNESGYSNEVSKTISGTADTTAPVLSNITTGSITSSGAVITWTTDEQSTSQIEHGTTTSYGSSTTLAPPDTTAPTGTISINSGAAYTTSTSVTLTLSCSDAGSGCSQMRLSN